MKALAPVLFAAAAASCGPAGGGEGPLRVQAAASLREALVEIGERYERERGTPVSFNFAASNLLARQVLAGARSDLFLSADEEQMDALERAGLILAGTRRELLTNALVVVQPDPLPPGIPRVRAAEDLAAAGIRRLSLADPRAVPAGRYARAWLEGLGLWERVAGRVVPAIDVRAALAAVEAGAADAGVVYATDAAVSDRSAVALRVEQGPPIAYPLAVLAGSERPEAARDLAAYLAGPAAREVFERRGFRALSPPAEPAGPERAPGEKR